MQVPGREGSRKFSEGERGILKHGKDTQRTEMERVSRKWPSSRVALARSRPERRGWQPPSNPRVSRTFPHPPSPGLARKTTPERLFHLMSTHVKETATQPQASGALGWDPPGSPEPGSRTDGAWSRRPSPPAGSKLSPTPGPPVTEGGRAGCRGRPGGCQGLQPPRRPSLPAGRRLHSQAGAAWASPIFRSAPRRPAALGEPLPPQHRAAAARCRPPRRLGSQPPQRKGSPGRLMPQARRPPPPGAQPLTCRCRRRRRRSSTFLQGGAPTRPGCRPLYSPPGQARGGAGASPERRNPPPG